MYSLTQAQEGEERGSVSQPPPNEVTAFVLRQQAQMPDYLRWPMRSATLAFDLQGWARTGRPFHHQGPASRQTQIHAWKQAKSSFQRDLIRYYESLATLAFQTQFSDGASDQTPPPPSAGVPRPVPGVISRPEWI